MFFPHLLTTIFNHFLHSLEHRNLDMIRILWANKREKKILFYKELNLVQEIWKHKKEIKTFYILVIFNQAL